jgi:hypothetical protein
MSLAVKKFINMRPQMPFRFSADIFLSGQNSDDILNISVRTVKANLGESDLTKGATYYGNGYFTIPIFNPAERSLEITFTETDNMDVLKFFDSIQERQFNRTPVELFIRVTEYDEKMKDILSKILYTCNLKEYSEPAFNRTGGVNIATIDATFIIKDMKDELTANGVEKVKYAKDSKVFKPDFAESNIEVIKEEMLKILADEETKRSLMDGKYINSEKANIMLAQDFYASVEEGTYTASEVEIAAKEVSAMLNNSIKLRNAVAQANENMIKERQEDVKRRKLEDFKSENKDREENYKMLVERMKVAGVNTSDTTAVVNYLNKEGFITDKYNKDKNGLCSTSTYLVAAITSGQESLGPAAGNGKDQDLRRYGYKKVNELSGSGSKDLDRLVKSGKLKEGDVINISYTDGSKYGHAVTVIKNPDGSLGFASDYKQKSSHGQSNPNRVGSFYIQRHS